MRTFWNFEIALSNAVIMLEVDGQEVDTGTWQGVPTEGKPDLVKVEVLNWQASVPVHREWGPGNPNTNVLGALQHELQPNLPWADDHFEERVSRVPSNPGEQYKNWPWWRGQDEAAMVHEGRGKDHMLAMVPIFTHTYQERFWPKFAGENERGRGGNGMRGLRYAYGDLDDVVNLLLREPYTNQAYLPIFFPEDTGAVHGGRVPCTLGYHFMLRQNRLHMWYEIRSCDYVRHLRDDLYLACRLLLWVLLELTAREAQENDDSHLWRDVEPGMLHFLAHSLHYHKGDARHVR